jgi:hypothetical protein
LEALGRTAFTRAIEAHEAECRLEGDEGPSGVVDAEEEELPPSPPPLCDDPRPLLELCEAAAPLLLEPARPVPAVMKRRVLIEEVIGEQQEADSDDDSCFDEAEHIDTPL